MGRRRRGERVGATTGEEQRLLDLLRRSLSSEEVDTVLAGALLALNHEGHARLDARLEPGTAETLRSVLARVDGTAGNPVLDPSPAKVAEEWRGAWEDWEECVLESSQEEGRYVTQEEEWEPPFLDSSALADALEEVARRLRPLIPQVADGDLDPGFSMADALTEAVEGIGASLPEWMDEWEPEGLFGPEVTGALIDWEWRTERRRVAESSVPSPFACLDRMRRLEETWDRAFLDGEAILTFVLELDPGQQREVLAGLDRDRRLPHWDSELRSVHSDWWAVFLALLERHDSDRYLEACLAQVPNDWRLAVPVAEDAARRGHHQVVTSAAAQGLAAWLGPRSEPGWAPTGDLLVRQWQLRHGVGEHDQLLRLLELWRRAAVATGAEEIAGALDLQLVALNRWQHLDDMVDALARAHRAGLGVLADRLGQQWRDLVTEATTERNPLPGMKTGSSWVPLLMEALQQPHEPAECLHQRLREWLEEVSASGRAFRASLGHLATLTLDLDSSALARAAPTLHRILTRHSPQGKDPLSTSRAATLDRLGARRLFPAFLGVWRLHAADLVPDPSSAAGSCYDDIVQWLRAARELDPSAADRILATWRETHRRRRNLWQSVAKAGLGER